MQAMCKKLTMTEVEIQKLSETLTRRLQECSDDEF